MTTEAAYTELVSRLKRAHVLGTVNGLLGWDEQVNLPPDSADLRGEQLALLAELQHAAASDPRVGELLTLLEGRPDELAADQRVVLKCSRRDYDRVVKLPPEFVREKARHSSQTFHAWARCKAAADFAGYALSARNQFAGTISRLERGAVTSIAVLTLPGGTSLSASVTNDAVDALALKVGQPATAVFKAYAVMLAVAMP